MTAPADDTRDRGPRPGHMPDAARGRAAGAARDTADVPLDPADVPPPGHPPAGDRDPTVGGAPDTADVPPADGGGRDSADVPPGGGGGRDTVEVPLPAGAGTAAVDPSGAPVAGGGDTADVPLVDGGRGPVEVPLPAGVGPAAVDPSGAPVAGEGDTADVPLVDGGRGPVEVPSPGEAGPAAVDPAGGSGRDTAELPLASGGGRDSVEVPLPAGAGAAAVDPSGAPVAGGGDTADVPLVDGGRDSVEVPLPAGAGAAAVDPSGAPVAGGGDTADVPLVDGGRGPVEVPLPAGAGAAAVDPSGAPVAGEGDTADVPLVDGGRGPVEVPLPAGAGPAAVDPSGAPAAGATGTPAGTGADAAGRDAARAGAAGPPVPVGSPLPPAAVGPVAAPPRRRTGVLAVAGLVAAGLLGWVLVDQVTGLPAGVALTVGDTVVTEAQLRQRIDVAEILYGVDPPAPGPDRDRFDRDAARSTAVALVVDREARRRGVTAPAADVDRAVQRVFAARFPDRAARDRELARRGLTEADVVAAVRRHLAEAGLRAQVLAAVPAVTDGDVRRAYGERRPASTERRRLLNIVVESRERAEEVLAQARAGTDWGALAVRFSRDDATRDTGGELGEVAAAELEAPYAAAAFAAGAGEFFGPVQTRAGWNVGQVVGVQAAVPVPFEEAGPQLRARLRAERETAAWTEFLRRQLAAADVEYAARYRPDDPDAPPAVPQAALPGG